MADEPGPMREASLPAKAGLVVSLLNSAGLMGLGAYCLKDAVDRASALHTATAGSAFLLGMISLFLPLLVQRRRA